MVYFFFWGGGGGGGGGGDQDILVKKITHGNSQRFLSYTSSSCMAS